MNTMLPFTIAREGEKIAFLKIFEKDGTEILETELEVQPNAGPPMHTDYQQDESFAIVSGKMAYQIEGEEVQYAFPGETVLVKAGLPHKFWNAGSELLLCKGYITPPGNYVYFLSALYQSINENKGKPGMYDGAFLLSRYKAEFSMQEIPAFVQKIIFPIVLFIGKLTGKNRKFGAAPVPVAA